ncbi:hypothetical protein HPB48_013042 [Haemaphysalis longicornis]|uniref:Monocarboxylate transporter n=1 Tax=Haemaphysalis longicornis TaxID=44386 RepID=A0A9J6GQ82_HAELO|nr:hypothetical protein HPB48_013042 [Haemaphysalis longicornis]
MTAIYFTFFAGFSQGLLTIGTSIVIVEYFQKYRSVSTGMKFVGRALTGIVGPSLLTFLKTAYGLKGTLLVVGGLLLNTVPLMLLLRHPRPLYLPACKGCRVVKQPENKTSVLVDRPAPDRANENIANTSTKHREVDVTETSSKLIDRVESTEDDTKTAPISVVCVKGIDSSERPSHLSPKSKNVSNIFGRTLAVLKLPCFYVVLLAITVIDFTFPILTTTVVDYGQDKGLREEDAVQLTSLLSFGGLCGHVLIPFIGDMSRACAMRCSRFYISHCGRVFSLHAARYELCECQCHHVCRRFAIWLFAHCEGSVDSRLSWCAQPGPVYRPPGYRGRAPSPQRTSPNW